MSFKKILIAVDGSTFAAHAADVGIDLARALKADLAFFHAIDPAAFLVPEGGVPADVLASLAERDARNLLTAFRERAALSPAALEFFEVGKPVTKIIDAARNWPADLIIVGSHSRGRIERLLLGSVAEGVLHHAPCPVLVVRAKP